MHRAPRTSRLFALTLTLGASTVLASPPPGQHDCHPSYRGACLDPNAIDYDCRGKGGNGPLYTGRVEVVVIGDDPFDLDRDRDGIGCEDSP